MDMLPKGFGTVNNDDPPKIEEPHRCIVGKICGKGNQDYSRCNIHSWIYYHDEAVMTLKVLGIIAACILVISGAIVAYNDYYYNETQPTRINIEGYNCGDLAEYVADKRYLYSYAEHRYEWLCVNQQIKEFQG